MSAKKPGTKASRLATTSVSKAEKDVEPGSKEETEKELVKLLHSTDPHVMELIRKVAGVFNVFDQSGQKVVDIREVGTIVRALGMYPTEADVQEILQIVEEPNSKGLIKYDRLVPYVVKLLLDGDRFPPISDDTLKISFMVLDKEKVGYFEMGRMKDIMMKEGEPFSLDEFDDMMRFTNGEEEDKFDWRAYMTKAGCIIEEKPAEN